MSDSRDLLTPAEASVVSGVALRTVYKILAQRLPRGLVARRDRHVYITPAGACACGSTARCPGKPAKVRRAVYRQVKPSSADLIEYQWGALRCLIDPKPAADGIASGLAAYRQAMDGITLDDDIRGGPLRSKEHACWSTISPTCWRKAFRRPNSRRITPISPTP